MSVLLAFVSTSTRNNTLPNDTTSTEKNAFLHKKLRRQIWLGAGAGLLVCFIIGSGIYPARSPDMMLTKNRAAFIAAFYKLQKDLWGKSEELWEGCFSLIATSLITVMGIAVSNARRFLWAIHTE